MLTVESSSKGHQKWTQREEPTGFLNHVVSYLLIFIGFLFSILFFPFCLRVVREYERGVLFRLGRLVGQKGPGVFFLLPFVDRLVVVDLRTITLDVPEQEVITKDSVTVKVNAVVFFRVSEATSSVVNVNDHIAATYLLSQTTLRSILGQSDLDEILSKRTEINRRLQHILDEETEPWGVKVSSVEVKDIILPHAMQRAMASQAEAERERRAKIISADGEFQASARLTEAARVMREQPTTMQLRFLQTLVEISSDKNQTIVVPVPVDIIGALMPNGSGSKKSSQKGKEVETITQSLLE